MSNEKNKVAIIGHGYVGKAMHKIFPDALIYDTNPFEAKNTMAEINRDCGLAIICVPTPMKDGDTEFASVDTSIVENVLKEVDTPLVLIKSTVPPGFTESANKKFGDGKQICFSPEYVGEGKYWISEWKYMSPTDPRTHEFQIIGGDPVTAEKICNYFVQKLGPEKTYYLISSTEAEIIKYMENCWGAMKVIFAQEFYDLCQKLGASYIKVREGWALDNRVEKMHTAVFVDNRGFGGKCYPKDLNGIVARGDELGVDMSLVKAVLRKNKEITK